MVSFRLYILILPFGENDFNIRTLALFSINNFINSRFSTYRLTRYADYIEVYKGASMWVRTFLV